MNERNESVLTVCNYAVQDDSQILKARVTIAPHMIQVIIAGEEPYTNIEGRDLRKVNVLMIDGNNLELLISEVDLICLERVIGTYMFPS